MLINHSQFVCRLSDDLAYNPIQPACATLGTPMENKSFDVDLLCIGSGPAGQRCAVQAAKLGKRVAVVEKQRCIGGVCIEKGTIPSKTFREAVRRFYSRPGLEASGQG